MAVIGGFRSDLSITRKTDGFRVCFVFQSRVSTKTVVIWSDSAKIRRKNISIYSQLNFNGFTGVKLNVSTDGSTHILLLFFFPKQIKFTGRIPGWYASCALFLAQLSEWEKAHSLKPNNLFAFQLTPLLIQRKIGLSFWDLEGVLGLSFWDSEGVLGLSFWIQRGS